MRKLLSMLCQAALWFFALIFGIVIIVDRHVDYYLSGYNVPLFPNIALVIVLVIALGLGPVRRLACRRRRSSTDTRHLPLAAYLIAPVAVFAIQLFVFHHAGFHTNWDVAELSRTALAPLPLADHSDLFWEPYLHRYPNNQFFVWLLRQVELTRTHIAPGIDPFDFFAHASCLAVSVGFALFMLIARKTCACRGTELFADVVFGMLFALSPWYMIPYSDSFGLLLCTTMLCCLVCIDCRPLRWGLAGLMGMLAIAIKPTAIFVLVAAVVSAAWIDASAAWSAQRARRRRDADGIDASAALSAPARLFGGWRARWKRAHAGNGVQGVPAPREKKAEPCGSETPTATVRRIPVPGSAFGVLAQIACLALGISLGLNVVNGARAELGINADPDQEITIHHYLMMGLNDPNDGSFFGEDADFSAHIDTVEDRIKLNVLVARNRLADYGPLGLADHLLRKLLLNYNDGTFGWHIEGYFIKEERGARGPIGDFLRAHIYMGNDCYPVFCTLQQSLWLLVLGLIPASLLAFRQRKSLDDTQVGPDDGRLYALATMLASVTALTVFLLVFEARARYLFLYGASYVLLAAYGLETLTPCLRRLQDITNRRDATPRAPLRSHKSAGPVRHARPTRTTASAR